MFRAVIFVGFKGDEFNRAMKVFGPPDIVARYADPRLFGDIAPGDTVVFANGEELNIARRANKPSFNDSMHF